MIDFPKALRSFKFAGRGAIHLFKVENNARIHALATVLAFGAGFGLRITRNEWLWIVLAVALVWITEALNSAIERAVDFVSPTYDPRAGEIKDLAAAAVLFAAALAASIGALVFGPYLIR